jgi:hypothetical protein
MSKIGSLKMSEDRTEEHRQYVAALGEDFGSLFYHSYQDVVRLRLNWRICKSMFGTNKERVDLLYDISGMTAHVIQSALWNSVVMGIRRLTDSAGSKKDKNISVRSFLVHYAGHNLLPELLRLTSLAVDNSNSARAWTNKRVAHSDWSVRLGHEAIPEISQREIDAAIDSIAAVVKFVAKTSFNTTISTSPTIGPEDDVWFLKHLFAGQESFKQKETISRSASHHGDWALRDSFYTFPRWLDAEDDPHDFID